MDKRISRSIYGSLIGDALGVPWEFKSRQYCVDNASRITIDTDEALVGEHRQRAGVYSDDGSMLLATCASLRSGQYNLQDIADRFVHWYFHSSHPYSSTDSVFDVGGTTANALARLRDGHDPLTSGASLFHNNGNGSLMRILPIVFYLNKFNQWSKDFNVEWSMIKQVGGLTHANLLSHLCCWFYVRVALSLIEDEETTKQEAVGYAMYDMHNYFEYIKDWNRELYNDTAWKVFEREIAYLWDSIKQYPDEIDHTGGKFTEHVTTPLTFETLKHDSGFVMTTLVNALWCFLNYDSYEEIVKRCIMLGGDTDTVACVAGGLAGLVYDIPESMMSGLVIQDYLKKIISEFEQNLSVDDNNTNTQQ